MFNKIKFLPICGLLILGSSCSFLNDTLNSLSNNNNVTSEITSTSLTSESTSLSTLTSTHTTTNTTSQNNNKDFTTVEFNDVTVDYDGKSHTITPTGVPYDAHYSYTSTSSYVDASTDEGYTISIKVYGSNYNTKYMSAKLVIKPLNFGNLVFEDKIYQYDTKEHSIEVSNLPSNATTTYKCLNKNGITNKATN